MELEVTFIETTRVKCRGWIELPQSLTNEDVDEIHMIGHSEAQIIFKAHVDLTDTGCGIYDRYVNRWTYSMDMDKENDETIADDMSWKEAK